MELHTLKYIAREKSTRSRCKSNHTNASQSQSISIISHRRRKLKQIDRDFHWKWWWNITKFAMNWCADRTKFSIIILSVWNLSWIRSDSVNESIEFRIGSIPIVSGKKVNVTKSWSSTSKKQHTHTHTINHWPDWYFKVCFEREKNLPKQKPHGTSFRMNPTNKKKWIHEK